MKIFEVLRGLRSISLVQKPTLMMKKCPPSNHKFINAEIKVNIAGPKFAYSKVCFEMMIDLKGASMELTHLSLDKICESG